MGETLAVVLVVIGAVSTLGTAGYKCYEAYKNNNQQILVLRNSPHKNNIEDVIVNELKNRKSGDSDTSVEIKINIHTHEDKEDNK